MHDMPADVFRIILSYVAPVDYLKVKLASKSFSDWASAEFKWKDMTKEEVIQGQTSLEAGLPRTRRLKHFICTHCGLVKPTTNFSDNQAVKTNHRRICISCGISRKVYTKGQLPKINGEEYIPCWHCKKAVPKYDNWEATLASGKAALTKLLEGSRTEDHHRERYITGDGRVLLWPHETTSLGNLPTMSGADDASQGGSTEPERLIFGRTDRKDWTWRERTCCMWKSIRVGCI